jgi:hypothetical protein
MTVGGDRETHCGQELLVYHQGVCQGAGTCRQGLALQWRYAGGYCRTHVQSSSATGRTVLVPDRGSTRQSENQGQPMMYSFISCMIHSCYPPRKVYENWHPCLDQDNYNVKIVEYLHMVLLRLTFDTYTNESSVCLDPNGFSRSDICVWVCIILVYVRMYVYTWRSVIFSFLEWRRFTTLSFRRTEKIWILRVGN